MPAIRRAYTGGLEAAFESRTGTAAGGGHYPMLLFLARLSVLWRRSQVVRQRSAKPPFVGSIPTGASLSHKNLGPPWWRPFFISGKVSRRILNRLLETAKSVQPGRAGTHECTNARSHAVGHVR